MNTKYSGTYESCLSDASNFLTPLSLCLLQVGWSRRHIINPGGDSLTSMLVRHCVTMCVAVSTRACVCLSVCMNLQRCNCVCWPSCQSWPIMHGSFHRLDYHLSLLPKGFLRTLPFPCGLFFSPKELCNCELYTYVHSHSVQCSKIANHVERTRNKIVWKLHFCAFVDYSLTFVCTCDPSVLGHDTSILLTICLHLDKQIT